MVIRFSLFDLLIGFDILEWSGVPLIKPVGMPLSDFKQYGLKDFDSGLFGFCQISLIITVNCPFSVLGWSRYKLTY